MPNTKLPAPARSPRSDMGALLRRSTRAALLTGAGGAAALIAGAHGAAAEAAPPPAPPAATAVAPAPAPAPGRAPGQQSPAGKATRTLTVRATRAAQLSAASATAPPTAPPADGPRRGRDLAVRPAPATAGGAIGGIEVTPGANASPSDKPSPTPVVSVPGTPSTSAGGSAGTATIQQGAAPTGGTDSSVGNGSTNTAIADTSTNVTVIDQHPIVIVGATGDTTINIVVGGVVTTTVTGVATNNSDGQAAITTGVDSQTTTALGVTSGGPVTVSGPGGTVTGTSVVTGNSSTNTAVVTQSPHIVVVQSIPIVLVHPDGRVTIHAVIAGVVITRVVGVGVNTSTGQASLPDGTPGTVVATGNDSNNTVIVLQTPDITVIFEIPITIIDPQGPVDIQAVIAGVVETHVDAVGINQSGGTAVANGGGAGATSTTPDSSTNSIVIVQAPTVSLQQRIPITITNPAGTVTIDAHIASMITTTLGVTAINQSTGSVMGAGSTSTGHDGVGSTMQVLQNPLVSIDSSVPITIADPLGAVHVSVSVADIVRTATQQTRGGSSPISGGPSLTDPALVDAGAMAGVLGQASLGEGPARHAIHALRFGAAPYTRHARRPAVAVGSAAAGVAATGSAGATSDRTAPGSTAQGQTAQGQTASMTGAGWSIAASANATRGHLAAVQTRLGTSPLGPVVVAALGLVSVLLVRRRRRYL